jgi:dolichol-phosphate mannosyltransferase
VIGAARVAVVVPAYNEARLIGRTLGSIPAFVDLVVVVDDASRDDTSGAAASCDDPRLRVVRHASNLGVGAAIVTGYGSAFEWGADVAAVMAGDAQMDPADLTALLAPVLDGRADYSKGDRLSHPNATRHMPLARLWGNRVLSLLTRLCTGLSLSDSQCGYTALSRTAYERLPLDRLWPRYGYPNDLLGLLALDGARVADVTVRPVYADERSGIGARHALLVIPLLLLRVAARRFSASLAPVAGQAERVPARTRTR